MVSPSKLRVLTLKMPFFVWPAWYFYGWNLHSLTGPWLYDANWNNDRIRFSIGKAFQKDLRTGCDELWLTEPKKYLTYQSNKVGRMSMASIQEYMRSIGWSLYLIGLSKWLHYKNPLMSHCGLNSFNALETPATKLAESWSIHWDILISQFNNDHQ